MILGTAPDAFFYVGKFNTMVYNANSVGFKVDYPENSPDAVLQAFNGEDVTIKLPDGLKSNEIGTFINKLHVIPYYKY